MQGLTSRQLPAELLKIRLNQQLTRLKELLQQSVKDKRRFSAEDDPFCLYQRIVSWFVMGRLSKHEYDRILETLLETSELIGNLLEEASYSHSSYCSSSSLFFSLLLA